jgi:hypothetical protein
VSAPDLVSARLARLVMARLGPDIAYAKANAIDLGAAEAVAGCLTVCPVAPRHDGGFDLTEDGIEAVVIEVVGEDYERVEDLLAWLPDRPARWRCMFGTAGALGASAAVNPATYFDHEPLMIFRTPLRWLQAGGLGLVPLDMRWTARFLFAISPMASTVACEDDVHAAEIAAARHALVDEQELVVPAESRLQQGVAA